jgi:hypothetical protein
MIWSHYVISFSIQIVKVLLAMRSERISKKSRQREQLVVAMLQQPTWDKAADAAGLSKTTAWRIKKTPEFQQEYRLARHESFSQSTARLQQAGTAAVSTLLKIMLDPNAPAASRVRAATSVLAQGARAMETEDIEARVSELEHAAQIAKPAPDSQRT